MALLNTDRDKPKMQARQVLGDVRVEGVDVFNKASEDLKTLRDSATPTGSCLPRNQPTGGSVGQGASFSEVAPQLLGLCPAPAGAQRGVETGQIRVY